MIRRRARRLLPPLAACALALFTVPAPVAAAPADPAPLLLRLPDLGPGYVVQELGSQLSTAPARRSTSRRDTPPAP